jgi:hypothetical protein
MLGQRALRGGSWNNKPRNVRAANRNNKTPDNRNNNIGLRLAQSACHSRVVPLTGGNREMQVSMILFPGLSGMSQPNSVQGMQVAEVVG